MGLQGKGGSSKFGLEGQASLRLEGVLEERGVCQSVGPSVGLSVCPSVRLSVCPLCFQILSKMVVVTTPDFFDKVYF